MKKRIFALLAIVLTFALLASSFVMFGVNAEDDANNNAEKITIGENEYEVFKDKKYDVYSDFAALVDGKSLGDEITFDDGWSMSVKYCTKGYDIGAWGESIKYKYCNPMNTDSETTGIKSNYYMSTSWYYGSVSFAPSKDKVMVFPSLTNLDEGIMPNHTYEPSLKLTYTAKESANIVLYDTTGVITCKGMEVAPYWQSETDNAKMTIKIYKNDTEIWPADSGATNVVYRSAQTINFPDLGEIAVNKGDTISVVFEGPIDTNGSGNLYSPRTGVFCNPVVAVTTNVPTKKVTVGENEYEIIGNEDDVYSDFTSLVNGKSLGDEVTFDDGWVMSIKYSDNGGWNNSPWGGSNAFKLVYCNPDPSNVQHTGIKSNYYCSKNFYRGSVTFADSKDRVIVFPGMTDIENTYTPAPAIKLTYTVPRDGKVILFDSTGKFTCKGLNTSPWWASENEKHTVTVKIYKNGTEIWPADTGANNVIKLGADTINFPDLGEMFVTKGDEFAITFDSYVEWIDEDGTANDRWQSPRTGVICNPAVAYTEYLSPEYKYVNIGDSTYIVKKDSIYNARDTIWDLVDEMDPNGYTAVDMTNSIWQAKLSYYKGSYAKGYTFATSKSVKVPTITQTTTDTGAWNTTWCQNSINFYDDVLYVSPWVSADKTAAATVDMVFTAPKKGDIVIYDTLGSIVPHAQKSDTSPFYAWLANNKNEVSVTIFKNKVKIWPTDNTTDNKITAVDDMIIFPDLGSFKVYEGDTVTVRFQEEGVVHNRTDWNGDGKLEDPCGRDAVRTDLEVAYLAVESPDPVTEMIQVGDKFYEVLIAEQYDAYAGLADTVKDIPLGDAVSTNDKTGLVEFKGNWSMAYQYTSDKGFGFKPWGENEKFDIKYCEPYYATAENSKSPGIKGLQPAYYLSINNFNNCFFTSSILFLEENKDLFISPSTAGAFTAENIDKTVQAPALKLTYTSNIEGKAVLYDRNGKFSGSGLANTPYWANENDKATVKIEIYHNNKKIWPTNNEAQIISKSNPEITFPDLGELDLKIGDKINYVFYANPESPATRAALICNPGVAFSEVINKVSMDEANSIVKTDANFGTEVMVLVSVIVALGGVVATMCVIAKKRAHN